MKVHSRRWFGAALLGAVAVAAGCGGSSANTGSASTKANGQVVYNASMRLEWVPQAQFAGFLVAQAKGWYEQAGVSMTVQPAGPSVFPQNELATGADTFGVQQVPQTIGANATGATEVDVMQYMENSESVYMARKSSGIKTLAEAKGKTVGLWFGGNQYEFFAMLKNAGIPNSAVHIVSQGFTVIPFLQGKYDLSQGTPFNELGLVEQKIPPSQLNLIYASQYNAAMLGDGLTTTRSMIQTHPEIVQKVVTASIRGWQWALNNPIQAAKISVSFNPQLTLGHQIFMMKAIGKLVCQGPTLKSGEGIGWIPTTAFATSQKILLQAKQIKHSINLGQAFTNQFVQNVPSKYRTVNCAPYTSGS